MDARSNDQQLQEALQNIDSRIALLQKTVQYPQVGMGKKILITLGLAFLSACTIRYWIDKFDPYFHPPSYVHEYDYSDIDRTLRGQH